MRNGQTEEISTADLLVGDVMLMDTGDILPADGLLFQGSDIRQDALRVQVLDRHIYLVRNMQHAHISRAFILA